MLRPRPPGPVISRSLRTGAGFTLVLPRRRLVYRHWDKEQYLPGETAELILEGEGIGSGRYEFVVERADTPDGPWTPVAAVEADVSADRATARFRIPQSPPQGKLTKVGWDHHKAKPGDQLAMHVEADGYEGGFLSIHVEKRNDRGEWEVCSRWQGQIEHGRYDTVFAVPRGRR